LSYWSFRLHRQFRRLQRYPRLRLPRRRRRSE